VSSKVVIEFIAQVNQVFSNLSNNNVRDTRLSNTISGLERSSNSEIVILYTG